MRNMVKLGNLCEVVTKGTTPTSVGHNFVPESDIKFIKVESLNTNGSILQKKVAFITKECHKALLRSQLKENDILFSIAGALGRVGVVNKDILPANTNQALAIIRLKDKNETAIRFLQYYFQSQSINDQINSFRGGVAQQNLSLTQIKDFNIPLLTQEKQQQIVEKLDTAFELIDRAKSNIEKNIQNAKELFQSKLNQVFLEKGDGWEEKKLKDLGKVQTGTTPPTKDIDNYGVYIPFVKPAHFNKNGQIISTDSFLSEKGVAKSRLINANSILMVCIGATIGKTGFTEIDVTCNQQINTLTPNKDYDHKFLYFGMISRVFQDNVLSQGKGAQATLPIINKSKWENLSLNVNKDLKVQKEIVLMFEKLSAQTEILQQKYQQKLANLEELKKSILEKAFKGELI